MIPDPVVEEVRIRADIAEIVGEHVPLKKAGKELRGLCPFHTEKTPSFYVVPAKGFYKCFGCGEAGDVFSFLMKRLGVGFQDAVRLLAAKVGVEIPAAEAEQRADEAHRALYEAAAFAADHFERQLADAVASRRAREYLERRGLPLEQAQRFRLGYAPEGWTVLRDAAAQHGIPESVLLAAGLVKESERGDGVYDRQRDRLVFPIPELGGRIVAFGGRALSSAEGVPKYLNTPETPIFHKGRMLYGLHWARGAIRREGAALVVEGNMDYVSLAAHGVDHAVAGLGTAMTPEQAALLARFTRRALLLYDSDAAGLRATFRSADALLRAGVHPLVVTLPPGEDPDSVVRAGGAEALAPFLDAAVDVLERKLQILAERGFLQDADGIRKALDGLLPTLRAAVDPTLRDIYVARVAERTGIRRETIEAQLAPDAVPALAELRRTSAGGDARRGLDRRGGYDRRRGGAGPGLLWPDAPAARPEVVGSAGATKLLLLMLKDEERVAAAAEAVEPAAFQDPALREIFEALIRCGGLRGRSPEVLGLGPAANQRLETLLASREELMEGDRIFEDSVRDMEVETLHGRLDDVHNGILAALGAGDEEKAQALTREKVTLIQALRQAGYSSERLARTRSRSRRGGTPDMGE
jgi:DNA primase